MGRKPNQLILEYFDRGARLNDNSNRYEQRCKACGEQFPKGRVETLTAHIEFKCPTIRRDDRARFLSQARPFLQPINETNRNLSDHPNGHESTKHQIVLPVSSPGNLTGLEALAEASRQLTCPEQPGILLPVQNRSIDPGLERVSLNHGSPIVGAGLEEAGDYNAYSTAATNGVHALSGASYSEPWLTSGDLTRGSDEARDHATLSEIAASATNLEAMIPQNTGEQQNRQPSNTTSVPHLQPSTAPELPMSYLTTQTQTQSAASSTISQPLGSDLEPSVGSSLIGSELVNESRDPNRGFQKPHGRAQKVRGKFTDSRRQEVQNIRKKGACIRCRMLRKTCSGESPCNTCASVISARVWKLDCVRTNIYKELDVFNTGAFGIMASRLLERSQGQSRLRRGQYSIRFAHAEKDVAPISFGARLEQRQDTQNAGTFGTETLPTALEVPFLDETPEQISSKLLPYMQMTISHLSYEEPSRFMGPSIRTALKIVQAGNEHPDTDLPASKARTQKTLTQDRLLALSLDLWALIQVVVSRPKDWQLSPAPHDVSTADQGQESAPVGSSALASPIQTSQCITAQLQAAAEQRASFISRNVMIELEKRLERKEKCQGFETFLVGILLLNCVERMSWAMRSVSDSGKDQDWPLEEPVNHYLDQAARFAEFLAKLYKMRGILLHVRQSAEDGILLPRPLNGPEVSEWLNGLHLSGRSCRLTQLSLRRPLHTTQRLAVIKPFILSDIGEGIKEVQIIQWFVEPEARVEQFDKLCEVQSDKAAVEHSIEISQPLCDIDVLSEIGLEDGLATAEQAGAPLSSQQPQKTTEQHQSLLDQDKIPQEVVGIKPNGKHSSLATPAVRDLLKDLNIDIFEVTGTGKDGRVLKEDVQRHAAARSASSRSSYSISQSSPNLPTTQNETSIPLTTIQSQMFKTMTRSLSIPHFLYADELDITHLSALRQSLNIHPPDHTPQQRLSYLPFIIKALALALQQYPLLNSCIDIHDNNPPRLIMRSQINIGIAMDTPQGLLVPNIKSVSHLSILTIASEITRLQSLAHAGKLSPQDLTGGTFTVSNIGSIGGTYVAPVIASEREVAILGIGKKRTVPAFDENGRVCRKEVMHFSWSADHRVVDGAAVARCAECVKGWVERPEGMVVRLR
ncbi:MAG: hypothetical protein Q9179_001816 [Wetmoreana sp. 5 TL-2023]